MPFEVLTRTVQRTLQNNARRQTGIAQQWFGTSPPVSGTLRVHRAFGDGIRTLLRDQREEGRKGGAFGKEKNKRVFFGRSLPGSEIRAK